MPTNRTPIRRRRAAHITPEVLAAFRRLQEAERAGTSDAWWQAHNIIHDALQLPPWEWPAVENPATVNPYPEGSFAAANWKKDERAVALYRELAALVEEVGT